MRLTNSSRASSYSNTTSQVASTSQVSSLTAPLVNAETAVIIQPIQPTVFTSTAPAVTFQLPDGQAIATETAQVFLSTSYITSAAPVPTSDTSANVAASSLPLAASETILSSLPAKGLSSSKAGAASEALSATTYAPPMFTLSPVEESSAVSVALSSVSAIGVLAVPRLRALFSRAWLLPARLPQRLVRPLRTGQECLDLPIPAHRRALQPLAVL